MGPAPWRPRHTLAVSLLHFRHIADQTTDTRQGRAEDPVQLTDAESPKQSQKMSFGLGCHPGESQVLVGGTEKWSNWSFLSL